MKLRTTDESVTKINAAIDRFGEVGRHQDATQRKKMPQAQGRGQTGTGVMLKTFYAIVTAAAIAAAFVAFPSLSPQVEARSVVQGAKADRADARPLANQCSQHGWPYFEAACLRDTRNAFGEARSVRLISSASPIVSQGRPVR